MNVSYVLVVAVCHLQSEAVTSTVAAVSFLLRSMTSGFAPAWRHHRQSVELSSYANHCWWKQLRSLLFFSSQMPRPNPSISNTPPRTKMNSKRWVLINDPSKGWLGVSNVGLVNRKHSCLGAELWLHDTAEDVVHRHRRRQHHVEAHEPQVMDASNKELTLREPPRIPRIKNQLTRTTKELKWEGTYGNLEDSSHADPMSGIWRPPGACWAKALGFVAVWDVILSTTLMPHRTKVQSSKGPIQKNKGSGSDNLSTISFQKKWALGSFHPSVAATCNSIFPPAQPGCPMAPMYCNPSMLLKSPPRFFNEDMNYLKKLYTIYYEISRKIIPYAGKHWYLP